MTRIATAAFRTKANTQSRLPFAAAAMIALFSGAIFSLALAPYYWVPVAILSPMLLYVVLKDCQSAKQAFWLGELYGFGTWAVGAFWLYHSIHYYGGVPTAMALVLIGVMSLVMGLFHALMAWAFVRFSAKQPMSFAGFWVVQEWLKTWFLSGFPWLFVGYAFTEVSWLNGIAPIFGVFGLSFLAVFIGAAIIELFRRNIGHVIIGGVLTGTAVIISVIGINWTKPTGSTTTVSLVQGNIPQDLKWQEGSGLQTIGIYAGLSQSEWGRDLVVWPETAIPMFQDEAVWQIQAIAQQASQAGSAWMTGIMYRLMPTVEGVMPILYNSVMLHDRDEVSVYKKQQLVPFGEYIPLGGLLDVLPGLEGMQGMVSLSRGHDDQDPLMLGGEHGEKIGAAICYEVAYPDTTRKNALGSDFLLTVSNDAWFGTTAGPIQHLQMVQMRSLENGRWFVRATNNGVTALIDHQGRVVSQIPQFERGVLRGEVPSYVGRTPYMVWGHYPVLGLAIVLILLSIWANKLKNTSAKREKYYTAEGVADR
ncbi:apolipoprotein N-acyltransferase [Moraxella canis]|uniref:Apolipoprotein N-acyltransferase n=1 Tax=Moraxella canis TaxID=90239 RepID=A0ABZ0WW94_9GAMM|nr:apolipoprotein N-acyltransferase [Moraxella canis]WQE03337.1 apolipoprotein N-acyltransferase [Moraxella canis]